MATHIPIGSCCSRPKFNAVGGVDTFTLPRRRRISCRAGSDGNHRATVFALVGSMHGIGRVVRRFAAMLVHGSSP